MQLFMVEIILPTVHIDVMQLYYQTINPAGTRRDNNVIITSLGCYLRSNPVVCMMDFIFINWG